MHDDLLIARGIGLRLWHRRTELGLSQADVARRATELGYPMDRSAISRYESGIRQAHETAIVGICLALGVSADWLLNMSDDAKKTR